MVLAARQEQWERAAALLGAAEGVCVAMGWRPPVAIASEYERVVRGARAALGMSEAGVALAAWAEGRALSLLESAIAFSRRRRRAMTRCHGDRPPLARGGRGCGAGAPG